MSAQAVNGDADAQREFESLLTQVDPITASSYRDKAHEHGIVLSAPALQIGWRQEAELSRDRLTFDTPDHSSAGTTPEKIRLPPRRFSHHELTQQLIANKVHPDDINLAHGDFQGLVDAHSRGRTDFTSMTPAPRAALPPTPPQLNAPERALSIMPAEIVQPEEPQPSALEVVTVPVVPQLTAPSAAAQPASSIPPVPRLPTAASTAPSVSPPQPEDSDPYPIIEVNNDYMFVSVHALRAAGVWEESWADSPMLFLDALRNLSGRPTPDRIAALESKIAALADKVDTNDKHQATALIASTADLQKRVTTLDSRVEGYKATVNKHGSRATEAWEAARKSAASASTAQDTADAVRRQATTAQEGLRRAFELLGEANARAQTAELKIAEDTHVTAKDIAELSDLVGRLFRSSQPGALAQVEHMVTHLNTLHAEILGAQDPAMQSRIHTCEANARAAIVSTDVLGKLIEDIGSQVKTLLPLIPAQMDATSNMLTMWAHLAEARDTLVGLDTWHRDWRADSNLAAREALPPKYVNPAPTFLPVDCEILLADPGVTVAFDDMYFAPDLQPLNPSQPSPLVTPKSAAGVGGGQAQMHDEEQLDKIFDHSAPHGDTISYPWYREAYPGPSNPTWPSVALHQSDRDQQELGISHYPADSLLPSYLQPGLMRTQAEFPTIPEGVETAASPPVESKQMDNAAVLNPGPSIAPEGKVPTPQEIARATRRELQQMHDVALQDPPPKSVRPSPPHVPALKLKGIVNPTFEGLGGAPSDSSSAGNANPLSSLTTPTTNTISLPFLGVPDTRVAQLTAKFDAMDIDFESKIASAIKVFTPSELAPISLSQKLAEVAVQDKPPTLPQPSLPPPPLPKPPRKGLPVRLSELPIPTRRVSTRTVKQMYTNLNESKMARASGAQPLMSNRSRKSAKGDADAEPKVVAMMAMHPAPAPFKDGLTILREFDEQFERDMERKGGHGGRYMYGHYAEDSDDERTLEAMYGDSDEAGVTSDTPRVAAAALPEPELDDVAAEFKAQWEAAMGEVTTPEPVPETVAPVSTEVPSDSGISEDANPPKESKRARKRRNQQAREAQQDAEPKAQPQTGKKPVPNNEWPVYVNPALEHFFSPEAASRVVDGKYQMTTEEADKFEIRANSRVSRIIGIDQSKHASALRLFNTSFTDMCTPKTALADSGADIGIGISEEIALKLGLTWVKGSAPLAGVGGVGSDNARADQEIVLRMGGDGREDDISTTPEGGCFTLSLRPVILNADVIKNIGHQCLIGQEVLWRGLASFDQFNEVMDISPAYPTSGCTDFGISIPCLMSKPRNPHVVMCLIGGTEQKPMSAYIPAPPPAHLLVVIPRVASNVSTAAPGQPFPKAVEAACPRAAEAETGNVIHSVTRALVNLMPTALRAKGTGSGTTRSVRSTSPKEGPRSSVLKKLPHARVAAPLYLGFPESDQPPDPRAVQGEEGRNEPEERHRCR
jgi:hypothetical protein